MSPFASGAVKSGAASPVATIVSVLRVTPKDSFVIGTDGGRDVGAGRLETAAGDDRAAAFTVARVPGGGENQGSPSDSEQFAVQLDEFPPQTDCRGRLLTLVVQKGYNCQRISHV
ncbi:hypothetical protein JCM9743_29020 [Natrinema sp. JCM 9743]